MSDNEIIKIGEHTLFDRVVSILEEARSNVVRAVNRNMVITYWLIGREIVEEIQEGKERAEYGKQVIEELSKRLNEKYEKGFSVANLKRFRQFYRVYSTRMIGSLAGSFSKNELAPRQGANSVNEAIQRQASDELQHIFNPDLSWSHYRALMRVKNCKARNFYEKEAAVCTWSKTQLERQIQSSYYERIIANQGEQGLIADNRERLAGDALAPVHVLKSPMVLEFLDMPDNPKLHESTIEQAIIDNLQAFLLELGKGFSFVARQKHIRFDDDDFYVDLVFYNYILKCFLLIDLKIGKLTHRDVGQIDGYVRLFEDQFKVTGDNPTVGLILCSDKSEAVAHYSVLSENKQLFAAKYLDFLPTEKELKIELEKERKLIEENL